MKYGPSEKSEPSDKDPKVFLFVPLSSSEPRDKNPEDVPFVPPSSKDRPVFRKSGEGAEGLKPGETVPESKESPANIEREIIERTMGHVRELVRKITDNLDVIKGSVHDLPANTGLGRERAERFGTDVESKLGDLGLAVRSIEVELSAMVDGTGSSQDRLRRAVSSTVTLEDAQDDMRDLQETYPDEITTIDAQTASGAKMGVFETLWDNLKNLARKFWKLFSKLLTPKEWTLKGKVKSTDLLPFLGELSMEIKFGA